MADIMKALVSEGKSREIRCDPITHALITISDDEAHMHGGKFWFIKTWLDIDKGTTPTVYMMFITPPMPDRVHAFTQLAAESEFTISIFRDAVLTDNGTPMAPQNVDQNLRTVPGLQPFVGPTVSDEGELIWGAKVGIGRTAGVNMSTNYEIIAASNTIYLYKIEKIEAATHWLDVDFWWYEAASKEILG